METTMRMKFPYIFTEIMWKYVGFPTIHKVEIFKKTSFKYHMTLINRREALHLVKSFLQYPI